MAEQVEAGIRQVGAEAKQSGAEAKQTEAGAARENPLIPNARLRQIYHAMAQARELEKVQPTARRGRAIGAYRDAAGAKSAAANFTGTRGLEAALVSAAVDLGPSDLVSDALAGGVVDYLRGTALSEILRTGKADAFRRSRMSGTGIRGGPAECGAMGRLPGAAGGVERIWAALGAAAALKAATAQAKAEAKEAEATQSATTARQAGVVVVYMLPGELTAAQWKKALRFAAEQELPVVFVVLPAARARGSKARPASKAVTVSALAHGCGVPAIVVDADDAVAIYRVAQESVGHARIGGGAALIECVPFVLVGSTGNARVTEDAIAGLERYMLQRGVASKAWMERKTKSFAKRVAR